MLKIESGNNYFTPIKGNHSVHILRNVPIFNRKPLLSNINSYTKFEENCADRRDGYDGVVLGIKNDLIYEKLEARDDVEAVFAKIPRGYGCLLTTQPFTWQSPARKMLKFCSRILITSINVSWNGIWSSILVSVL